jgi:outer membrane protein assembly factor BamB
MILRPDTNTTRLLQRIAITAGLFALLICFLVLLNYYQFRRSDPLNTPALKVMMEKLKANPEDEQLKEEIREMDLLTRKAFFTSRWQIKTGGYLLVFSVLVVIICLQAVELMKPRIPVKPGESPPPFWEQRLLNRKWLIYSGLALVIFAIVLTLITHEQLGSDPEQKLSESSQPPVVNHADTLGTSGINETVKVNDSLKQDSLTMVASIPFADDAAMAKNFPSFRGYGGYGVTRAKNVPTSWNGKTGKNIRWKSSVPLPGYNSPIIWNDRIFLTGANATRREVYCYSLNDGKLLWQTVVEKIKGSPAAAPKVISETGHAAPTMATDGVRVYAIFANGDLVAMDMDGKQLWGKNLGMPRNHYGHSSSLITYRDLVIVQYDQSGDGSVTAFRGITGEQTWKTSRNVKVSWASPILVKSGGKAELILLAEPLMIAYDPATGRELWKNDCISGEVGPSAAYADGIAFSVNEYSKLAAVQAGNPASILWENDELLSDIPSPVATRDYLFLPTSYGTMACYDAKKGTKYWEKDFGTPLFGSPIVAEGKVFQMDKKGVMHIFSADKSYNPVGESQLGEGSSCTPAFTDGMIVIRGDKNLYCISNSVK